MHFLGLYHRSFLIVLVIFDVQSESTIHYCQRVLFLGKR